MGVAIDLVVGWPKRVTQTMHTNVIERRAGVEPRIMLGDSNIGKLEYCGTINDHDGHKYRARQSSGARHWEGRT